MSSFELMTHGNSVQVQEPNDLVDLTITRWGFGAELSLAPQANPPKDKIYTFTFSIPTPTYFENMPDPQLYRVRLHFNSSFSGKLKSVGPSGEIRNVVVFLGALGIQSFPNLQLTGIDALESFSINPKVATTSYAVSISLGIRFDPEDRGAFLLIGAGASFTS